ncbi:MAG: NAD(P)/FAD-dependent oxidoreductase [Phycisphaerales bacterium]
MPESFDIAVVGAGPSGCACALLAARRGARVVVFDKATFPRAKPCGGCIGATGVRLMEDLGLTDALRRATRAHTTELRLASPRRSARLPLHGGRVVDRAVFDASLLELARASGVEVRTGRPVDRVEQDDSGVRVSAGDECSASVAIVARGLGRTPPGVGITERVSRRAYIGVGAHIRDASGAYESGVTFMHAARGGYVGVVRLDRETLDIALAVDPARTRTLGVAGFVRDTLRRTSAPVPDRLDEAPWKGTPELTRTPRSVASGRVLLAGDSAGYVEPFTGEGMTWAVASGALASSVACAWLDDPAFDLAREYARAHRQRVARRRSGCRLVRASLRCPPLLDAAIRCASVSSMFSRLALNAFERPYRVAGASP